MAQLWRSRRGKVARSVRSDVCEEHGLRGLSETDTTRGEYFCMYDGSTLRMEEGLRGRGVDKENKRHLLHQMFPLRDNGGVTLRWSRVKMSEGEREELTEWSLYMSGDFSVRLVCHVFFEKEGVDDDVDLKIQQFLMVPISKSGLTLTGLDMLRRLSDGEWRRRG